MSWLPGAVAGALASVLLTPFTTWIQESVRRNKEARGKVLAEAVLFRNELSRIAKERESLTLNEVIDYVARLAILLNTPDIDETSQNRSYSKLEYVSSKVWVDFFKTCPSELTKQLLYDRLAEAFGGVGLGRNELELKEAIYNRNIKLETSEFLKTVNEIIATLRKHPLRVWGWYCWNLFAWGKEGAYK